MAEFNYNTELGTIIPDTSETIAQVEAMHREAWGPNVVLEPETPLGKIAVTDTIILNSAAQSQAIAANMLNPDMASGIALDALGAMLRIYRREATRSILTGVQLRGVEGTLIPAGSICVDVNGERWEMSGSVVLDSNGLGESTFLSVNTGPIECAVGELNAIEPESVVSGWEAVENFSSAAVGSPKESNPQFRRRRRRELAKNSSGSLIAIDAALFGIPNVRSISRRENYTDQTQVIDFVTMVPHSIWYCVEGGDDLEVATAIMSKKDPGCNFNGNITVPVTEPFSGQVYNVKFDRPEVVNVLVRVTCSSSNLNTTSIVRDAIMSYVSGQIEGEQGFVIGTSVSPFEISGAINMVEPRIFVRKVELSIDNGVSWSTSIEEMRVHQLPVISRPQIDVVIV